MTGSNALGYDGQALEVKSFRHCLDVVFVKGLERELGF